MSFLDQSIIIRKSCDNSEKNSDNSQDFVGCSEENYISHNQSSKRPREEDSKFDDALNKLLNISHKEDEFTAFATSLAFQLQKLPEEDAYELMGEMQNLLVQRKIKNLRCSRFRPISANANSLNPAEYSAYNTPTSYSFDERSSTPLESSIPCSSANSDILSCVIFDAGIEYEN